MSKILFITILMVSGSIFGTTLTINKSRSILIEGTIGPNIEKILNQFKVLINSGKDDIFIVIDSKGGYIDSSESIISLINLAKLNGISINCSSTTKVGSSALNIMMTCSNKYALKSTLFLFHQGRVRATNITLTTSHVGKIYKDLTKHDNRTKSLLKQSLKLSVGIIERLFYKDVWLSADELNLLSTETPLIIVDNVVTLPPPSKNNK